MRFPRWPVWKWIIEAIFGKVSVPEYPPNDDPNPRPPDPEPEPPEPEGWIKQARYGHGDFPGSIESGEINFDLKNVGDVPIEHGSIFLHFEGITTAGDTQNLHAMVYDHKNEKMFRFVRHHWDESNSRKLSAQLDNHTLPPDPNQLINIKVVWNKFGVRATLTHGPHVREYSLHWIDPMHSLNFLRFGEGVYPGRNGQPIGHDVMTRGKVTIE